MSVTEDDISVPDQEVSPEENPLRDISQNREREEPETDVLLTENKGDLVQWSVYGNGIYVPAGKVIDALIPGAYNIEQAQNIGTYFKRLPVKTEGLLELPDSNLAKVLSEITKFWEREAQFKKYDLAHKRGILLFGPPGCGKSSCIQLLMKDVIGRGGVVLNFGNPSVFLDGYRIMRTIQPETPVIVIMEDVDAILANYNESQVLNILDGLERIHRTVFLATTNYPERLGARIVNRPSRFDKRFRMGFPSFASRKLYLEFITKYESEVDVDQWAKDTKGFTLAHLKELFVAVVILGDEYPEALKTLKLMTENKIGSFNDDDPEDESEPSGAVVGRYA